MAKISSLNIIESTCDRPWEVAVDPFRITEQIYYVGNAWVGAYLIDTGDGLILLDTTTAETSYQLVDSICRLGFQPRNIKLILLSHAHIDHDGAARFIQELTQAKLYLSTEDDAFRHTDAASYVGLDLKFKPYDYTVDVHYADSEAICLGEVKIRTLLTPGHTPGTTTFFIEAPAPDGGTLTAAMHGGVGVLTMSDEAFRQSGLSPELRRRFIRDCDAMKHMPVDICLPSHPAHAPLFEMRDRGWGGENPFIDPNGWANFLESRVKFAKELEENSQH